MMTTSHDDRNTERRQFPVQESLPVEARRHADAHRWWESERYGRDLGNAAYRDWYNRYWPAFCRWRWYEHITGKRWFIEFGAESYGRLADVHSDPDVRFVLHSYLEHGWENLQILYYAPGHYSRNALLQVLLALDINGLRSFPPPDWIEEDNPCYA